MAKIVHRQMPAPKKLSQQIPAPRAKARMQKPQGGGKLLVQIPGGAREGGMVMGEIDTCISLFSLSKNSTRLLHTVLARKLFFDLYIGDKQQTHARRWSENNRGHIYISINPETNAIFQLISREALC